MTKPVLTSCLYCGARIEIRIAKSGRLWQANPGTNDTHGCIGRRALKTHSRDKDIKPPKN